MMEKLQAFIENAGWPRIIIGLFLLSLFVAAPFVGVRLDASLSDTLVRVGMNGILVLAMVPMVQSGCGLNFGLPLGIIAGLLGAVTSIQIGIPGSIGFIIAMGIAVPIAIVLGWLYLRQFNPPLPSLLVSMTFFLLSASVIYAFWLTPETFNMFCVMAGLFLWLYQREQRGEASSKRCKHPGGLIAAQRWGKAR